MKTKYRIVPQETYLASWYLQFLDETGKKHKWRYIPEEVYGYVIGDILNQKDCPTKLNNFEGYVMRGFSDSKLVEFTEKYPHIEDYFKKLRLMRESYLFRQEARKNRKIQYL